MPLSTGQLLQHDRYRIVSLLGHGGMGAVYRAWDTSLNFPVAIKENLDASPEAQRQFGNEAGMLARLAHPNLPRVTDYFFVPGQGQYLVMDFIQGEDLQAKLDAAREAPPYIAGLQEAQALPWIIQVCEALEYLHSQPSPVIHRDIKPSNIKIRPDGRAILVDFGIAKLYNPTLATTMGAKAVTPGFSPPEQYAGGHTDMRSDIYALGATFYYLLTGVRPPESLQRMTRSVPMPEARQLIPAISPATSQAIERATQVDSEKRFQLVSEFKRALSAPMPATAFGPEPVKQAVPAALATQVIQGPVASTTPVVPTTPVDSTPPTVPPPLVMPKRKIPVWLIAGGVLLVVAIVAFLAIFLSGGESPKTTAVPVTDIPTLAAVVPTLALTNTPLIPTKVLATKVQPTLRPTEVPTALPPTAPPTDLPAVDASGYKPVTKLILPAASGQLIRWVDVVPPYAYVLSREGSLYTYDLALLFKGEPPQEQYDKPVSQTQLATWRNGLFRYAGLIYAFDSGGIQIFDLTNPGEPSLGEKIPSPQFYNYAIQGNLLAVGTSSGYLMADVTKPLTFQWITKVNLGAFVYGIELHDYFLYTSEFKKDPFGSFTLRAYDISAPRTPKALFSIKTKESAYHLKIYGDQMVACSDHAVELWSLVDPASPVLTASQPASARVCAMDGANVITAGDVFRIEGEDLVKLTSFSGAGSNGDGSPYGSAVTDHFIFLAFNEYVLVLQKEY